MGGVASILGGKQKVEEESKDEEAENGVIIEDKAEEDDHVKVSDLLDESVSSGSISSDERPGHHHHRNDELKSFKLGKLDIFYYDVNAVVMPFSWLHPHKAVLMAYGVRVPTQDLLSFEDIFSAKKPIYANSVMGKKMRLVLNCYGKRVAKVCAP